jgi:hypothetical protein
VSGSAETAATDTERGDVRWSWSAIAFLASAVLATIGVLARWPLPTFAAISFLAVFIVLELPRVASGQRLVAAFLMALGTGLAWWSGRPLPALIDAGEGGLLFLVLFCAVTFIQYPAVMSPSMQQAREVILRQPPGRRYLAVSSAAHFLGALINFAALSLLASFLHRPLDTEVRARMAAAMSRGFAIAASWSPFFVAMAVILSVMPELSWLDIAMPGIPLALLMLTYGWLFDRLTRRSVRTAPREDVGAATARPAFARLLVLAVALVTLVIAVSESRRMPMPVAIFLVVPLFSLVWQWIIDHGLPESHRGGASGLMRHAGLALPGLRAEVLLFLAANVLGQGIASYFDSGSVETLLRGAGLTGTAAIFFILAAMVLCSALAVHPLVLIVVGGHVLPVERLDMAPESLGLIMASVWGLGVVVSPISGLTLFMARTLRISNWRVAWRHNGAYALIGMLICGTFIAAYNAYIH